MKYLFSLSLFFCMACNSGQQRNLSSDSTLSDTTLMMTPVIDSMDIKRIADSTAAADELTQKNKLINGTGAWKYSEDDDALTSKKVYHAVLQADNALYLNAPYDGGSDCFIDLRYKDGDNNVIVSVSKGQFLVNVVDGENIKVR